MDKKYLKVLFKNKGANFEYKIDEVNIARTWNPSASKGRECGGFNFTTEDKILRWLHRGDTLYDVIIPDDAEIVNIPSSSTPNGVFRSNKIIITNPRPMSDELAFHFYQISTIPELSYYKALGAVCLRNYRKTAMTIIQDKVTSENIDIVLKEWNDFINCDDKINNDYPLVSEVNSYLEEIKSSLLISRFISKTPYKKQLTDDNIINITGESGSGKSFFTKNYPKDKYIIIDTDCIFSDEEASDDILKLRYFFKDNVKDDFINDFDNCYLKIIDCFKDTNKTLVIDSAQYRNIKDISILKGKIIVMRTSINVCYERSIKRWIQNNPNYNNEDYEKYAKKKEGMFTWYQSLNTFLKRLEDKNNYI